MWILQPWCCWKLENSDKIFRNKAESKLLKSYSTSFPKCKFYLFVHTVTLLVVIKLQSIIGKLWDKQFQNDTICYYCDKHKRTLWFINSKYRISVMLFTYFTWKSVARGTYGSEFVKPTASTDYQCTEYLSIIDVMIIWWHVIWRISFGVKPVILIHSYTAEWFVFFFSFLKSI